MNYQIQFFAESVRTAIEKWPAGIYASFVRIEGIGRAFFCCMKGKRIVILHGFVKKTQATPMEELRLAKQRMKEVFND